MKIIKKIKRKMYWIIQDFKKITCKLSPRIYNLANVIYVRWLGFEFYFKKEN
jgi:hypothetical protein